VCCRRFQSPTAQVDAWTDPSAPSLELIATLDQIGVPKKKKSQPIKLREYVGHVTATMLQGGDASNRFSVVADGVPYGPFSKVAVSPSKGCIATEEGPSRQDQITIITYFPV
jgi:hypothetical protein